MKYLVANFKMNPQTKAEMEAWLETFSKYRNVDMSKCRVVLCPPFVWLPVVVSRISYFVSGIESPKLGVKNQIRNTKYEIPNTSVGAQDVFWEPQGAYTGEISAAMLKDIGCKYVIVGHSERRALGETDEAVHKKLKAALKAGLKAILAVGEKTRSTNAKGVMEREVGEALEAQLKTALTVIPKTWFGRLVVAYEPVWAVGTGTAATPDDAVKAALTIRKTVAPFLGVREAKRLPVLYGGSVTAENVGSFLAEEAIDGVLAGGASLDVKEFLAMVAIAGETR